VQFVRGDYCERRHKLTDDRHAFAGIVTGRRKCKLLQK
jgi:hypothetical protein